MYMFFAYFVLLSLLGAKMRANSAASAMREQSARLIYLIE